MFQCPTINASIIHISVLIKSDKTCFCTLNKFRTNILCNYFEYHHFQLVFLLLLSKKKKEESFSFSRTSLRIFTALSKPLLFHEYFFPRRETCANFAKRLTLLNNAHWDAPLPFHFLDEDAIPSLSFPRSSIEQFENRSIASCSSNLS